MSDNIKPSYPDSEGSLRRSLSKFGFQSVSERILDQEILQRRLCVSEYLWTDVRFFDVCNELGDNWLVNIVSPTHDYYLDQYGVLPVVFGSAIETVEEYDATIRRSIGRSSADTISILWEECLVFSNKSSWAFEFDRAEELGYFYCREDVKIPADLSSLSWADCIQ